MNSVNLSGWSAIAVLMSPEMKTLDADFEKKLYITRSEHNFMAYLNGLAGLPPLEGAHKDPPKLTSREARELADAICVPLPLEVSVSAASRRRNSKYLHCVMSPLAVQTGSFFRMREGLYCAAPEAAVLSVVDDLTDAELVILLSLMFSVFAKDQKAGKLLPRRALSSPELMLGFLDRCEQSGARLPKGGRRLRRLVSRAVVKAASPTEIECALRFGGGVDWGGCGFGQPEMNYRLDIPHSTRKRFVDLYWPTQNVAVEYQGGEEHMGAEALEADALHRNDLMEAGVPVYEITAGQLRDLDAFNRVARQIERALNRNAKKQAKPFPSDAAFHDKQQALKAEIDAAFARFGF